MNNIVFGWRVWIITAQGDGVVPTIDPTTGKAYFCFRAEVSHQTSFRVNSTQLTFILNQRTLDSIVFAIAIAAINWLLTLLMVGVVIVVELARRNVHKRGAPPKEILLLPVTLMLSLPALRDAMPGNPDFGLY